jgi:hypothetical protein
LFRSVVGSRLGQLADRLSEVDDIAGRDDIAGGVAGDCVAARLHAPHQPYTLLRMVRYLDPGNWIARTFGPTKVMHWVIGTNRFDLVERYRGANCVDDQEALLEMAAAPDAQDVWIVDQWLEVNRRRQEVDRANRRYSPKTGGSQSLP